MAEHILQQLDDSQLVSFINSQLHTPSQAAPLADRLHEFATSTPCKQPLQASFASSATDPFDDNLDSALLRLAPPPPPPARASDSAKHSSMSDSMPGNQLALVDTDDDGFSAASEGAEEGKAESVSIERGGAESGAAAASAGSETATGGSHSNSPERPGSRRSSGGGSGSDGAGAAETTFGAVGPQHDFGDFETYFQNKARKQQLADQEFVRWDRRRRLAAGDASEPPQIFRGCTVFVNGNTDPSLTAIHKLVVLRGGVFLSYLPNKGAATHIVCDRLTPRKRTEYRNYRVVRAQWVADCVKRGVLLDWKDYRLIDDKEAMQTTLGFEKLEPAPGLEIRAAGRAGAEHDRHLRRLSEGAWGGDDGDNCDDGRENASSDGLPRPTPGEAAEAWRSDQFAGRLSDSKDFDGFGDGLDRPDEPLNDRLINEDLSDSHWDEGIGDFPDNHWDEDIDDLSDNHWDEDIEGPSDKDRLQPKSGKAASSADITEPATHAHPNRLSQFTVSKPRRSYAQMDAKHPDFLRHFFANSRLHHLSTWKADLRAKFVRLIAKGYQSPPKVAGCMPVILHIDFDCFFATASTLRHPKLDIFRDAIAVSHGGQSSDIASCNYRAREKGVRNGMWLGRAMEKCPELQVVDYDFEAYERFSHVFYNYLVSRKIFDSIYPVSIDEVLVDASSFCSRGDFAHTVADLCSAVRADILRLTQCPVSVGAARNVLLAKLALRQAKPNGQFHLHTDIDRFLDKTDIQQLPGIGGGLFRKLADALGVPESEPITVGRVKELSLQSLVKIFGEKTGLRVFENCRGRDPTSIDLDADAVRRKTVSVDVNFGIRFDTFAQVEVFLMSLAQELHSRLVDLGLCGSSVSLRLARKTPDAPVNPPKYMGMGQCTFCSKSSAMGVPTNDWGILGSEMKALLRILNVPAPELRGIAVSVTKLEDVDVVKKQRQQQLDFKRKVQPPVAALGASQNIPFAERVTGSESIDWAVFNSLPDEIRVELKRELLRRGISVSARESPKKENPRKTDGKVYLQQTFPTQPYGDFKVKRVLESPKKKKKLVSPKKARRSESPTPYNDTVSYDEAVLQEIPSSIRREFMEEVEWQRKHKKLGFVSYKQKMERRAERERLVREQVVDTAWLAAQPRLVEFCNFNGYAGSVHELVQDLRSWVEVTLPQEGPHSEDVELFEEYLLAVAVQGNITRSVKLLEAVESEVQRRETVSQLCGSASESVALGLEDWKAHLGRLRAAVVAECSKRGIVL